MTQSADILIDDVKKLRVVIAKKANEHKFTPVHRTQPWHPRRADDLRSEDGADV